MSAIARIFAVFAAAPIVVWLFLLVGAGLSGLDVAPVVQYWLPLAFIGSACVVLCGFVVAGAIWLVDRPHRRR